MNGLGGVPRQGLPGRATMGEGAGEKSLFLASKSSALLEDMVSE